MTDKVVDGVFKTGDMVEAAILSLHGLSPAFERRGSRVIFVFNFLEDDAEAGYFEDLVAEVRGGKCRVEPRRFAREMRAVRDMMYTFVGITREDRRLRRT